MKKFSKFLSLLNKSEKLFLVFIFLISFLVMGFEIFGVTAIPLIFAKILDFGNLSEYDKIPEFLNNFLSQYDAKSGLIFFIIILFFLKSLINYFHFILEWVAIKRIRIRLTHKWFKDTLNQNYLEIQNTPVSHKIWLTVLIETFTGIISNYLNLFKGIIICLSILFLVIFFSTGNLLLFYFSILFLLILFYSFFSRKISNYGKLTALADKERLDVLQSTFIGIKNILIYRKIFFFVTEFIDKNIKIEKNKQSNTFIAGLPYNFLEFIGVLFICIYFFLTIKQNIPKSEILFNVGIVVYGSLRILSYFKVVTQNYNLIRDRKFDVNTLIDHLKKLEKNIKDKNISSIKYSSNLGEFVSLEIKKLKFNFRDKNIININNFKFLKNKFYIIVGQSGVGKSTFLDLMLDILKPSEGEIKFSLPQKSIGYVSQETFLLNSSIKKNIAFAEYEDEIDINKLNNVIEKCNLKEFVNSFKEKENYIIKNNGSNLSVGQKQRIGIARALYYEPEIIFLDEPTSSLDQDNETLILDTFSKIKLNSTIIMVTHKYKNLKNYDKLLELENGDLIEKN